ncbi:hypothetical protein O3M35_005759 [Rhynocoris fuscipes]|uniref:Uncharacterized protein n=1 Tax=Rhynocoris fuscipes TaxID=488301 RepID=A0AAW1DLI4_9HEMI
MFLYYFYFQHQKTFTIFGKYPSIREALKSRGWVQNFDLSRLTVPKQRQFDDDGKNLFMLEFLLS